MRGRALIVLMLVCPVGCAGSRATPPASPAAVAAFREGTALLGQGKDARASFARAVQEFQAASDGVIESPGRAQNLGAAAFLAGDPAQAIASFRAGLMLDPHHPALRAHLAYARSQVQYPIDRGRPEPDFWPRWLPRLGSSSWLILGVGGYFLAWICGTCRWFDCRLRWAVLAAAFFALAAISTYAWLVMERERERDWRYPVVVLAAEEAFLRTGNGSSYPLHTSLPTVRRGMEARVLHRRGAWLQVRFASGGVGWIDAAGHVVQLMTSGPYPASGLRRPEGA